MKRRKIEYLLILALTLCCSKPMRKIGEPLLTPQQGEAPISPPPPELPPIAPAEEKGLPFNKKFSLYSNGIRLEEALSELLNGTGLTLLIEEGVERNKKIFVNFEGADLEEALAKLLHPLGYSYSIKEGKVVVSPYETLYFELGYIPMKLTSSIDIGGSILGNEGEASLVGFVSVEGKSDENAINFWKQLEDGIKKLLSPEGIYSINKLTGTVMVRDRRENVILVRNLLEKTKETLSRQVLLEVKVFEVALTKERGWGIDWSFLTKRIIDEEKIIFSGATSLPLEAHSFLLSASHDLSQVVLQAIEEYGDVEILSNPRVKVMNGQTAIFSAGRILAFWELTAQAAGAEAGTPAVFPERKSVLVGLLLGLTPFISDDGTITLQITPIVTDVTDWERFVWMGNEIKAPDVDVRQSATIVRAKDGESVIIGGLISSKKMKRVRSIPILANIPLLGYLFKREETKKVKTELVIMITPHIVEGG